ncbi:monovalent cation/H+ antiporter complex subunit F [Pseudoruegeria sp. SHC-113]|uniref:monovalent cation/H+ antiporter complex subunit F n=1 Tax=Pseudoruegeria sp. SHC-113 TaxID=2855439 RepID=UPI0021BB1790|nr:monovalent cation/H+ antiporter complex subunit F [Pseudoruegeria sp. SHC-113]MCT8160713.1 pH regulation protein F [Pseudoruegeria sp. SHC-113]
MTSAGFLAFSVNAGFVMIVLALVLGFIRLIKGPSLPDRVVALDMMTILIVAFCGLFAVATRDQTFLDVALVMALVGFLATVALARFAERRVRRRRRAARLNEQVAEVVEAADESVKGGSDA